MAEFVADRGKSGRPEAADGRLDAPAFHRNREPIWAVLAPFLEGKSGDMLEAGSGSGQHAVEFARKSPAIVWWPSDDTDTHLASIEAWRRHAGLANVRPPLKLDLAEPGWRLAGQEFPPAGNLLAIFCANVVHIAPWKVAEGLIGGAARLLRPEGRLFVYGPFKRGGEHTAPSNARFDASLRAENPEWGVRDVGDLRALASQSGLKLAEIVEMPANNLILVFERDG